MERFIEEMEDRLALLRKCVTNGLDDTNPDYEIISTHTREQTAIRISLAALYQINRGI